MLTDKVAGFAARHYQKAVASKLQQTGTLLCFESEQWEFSRVPMHYRTSISILLYLSLIPIIQTHFFHLSTLFIHSNYLVGLRYEDLLNEDETPIKEALSFADPDVVAGRTRRVKRAIDLSFKRKNMLDYAPDVDQNTFASEFYDDVVKIQKRDQEYAMLNVHKK